MKKKLFALCVVCFVVAFSGTQLRAEEPKKEAATPRAVDPYKVPEGADSAALVEFCKKVTTLRPRATTQAEYNENQTKLRAAIQAACNQILTLEKGDKTPNGRFARRNLLAMGVTTAGMNKQYLEDVKAFISAQELGTDDMSMVLGVGRALEFSDTAKAVEFYTFAKDQMAKSSVAAISAYAPRVEGMIRRISLVGNEMELKGKTFEGKDFDLTSLKGKVVLVDFWATWCGPCRAELPNVKANYAGYHNKGFEVVGISSDRDRLALEKFLTADPLPWVTLHEMEGGKFKQNAASMYYGITAIPTTILVGKDGKVLSINARGAKLGELLKTQFGEPEAVPAPAPKPAVKSAG